MRLGKRIPDLSFNQDLMSLTHSAYGGSRGSSRYDPLASRFGKRAPSLSFNQDLHSLANQYREGMYLQTFGFFLSVYIIFGGDPTGSTSKCCAEGENKHPCKLAHKHRYLYLYMGCPAASQACRMTIFRLEPIRRCTKPVEPPW